MMKTLSAHDQQKLKNLQQHLESLRHTQIGYPCNQCVDYTAITPFLEYTINNVGDPFAGSNFRMNTHDFEREVLASFAEFTQAPADAYWGYVTNGGTEGNMYGLYLARELMRNGIVYFSEDTHYSLAKLLRLLNIRNIMIKSQSNGEMDYEDLYETLRLHRDVSPIIFANIGTTMKGAVDDVAGIKTMMADLAITEYYIHCDAALSGMILPFVDEPQAFDFSAGIDSISISGHKLLGSPLPCGIVLAKKPHVERIARAVEYVGVLDTTIMGSRNAFTPLLLWYAIHTLGKQGITQIVSDSIARADYAIDTFRQAGIECWRNKNSITVVMPRPSNKVLDKWQIAPYRDIGHIITLPHVTEAIIQEVADDMRKYPSTKM
jgi:histidine decarboxylase